ncbi:MAG: hypothetical protein H0T73_15255 [Ardenticatenales bacterium]|nr:hypothetical protein [Ardenticatenales bacterium]
MSPEEKTARLNLVRYGMLIVVVLAMTITPSALFLATSQVGAPLDVLPITLGMTVAVAIVAGLVYFAYSKYLERA